MIKRKCSPRCDWFPNEQYNSIVDYEIDRYGVKKSNVKARCYYSNKLITSWQYCENFKVMPKKFHNKKAIVFLGKSAAGKDSAINALVNHQVAKPIVSHTTRPMREKERNGIDYHFISESEFDKMIKDKDFIDNRSYLTSVDGIVQTWKYGISKKEVENQEKILTCAVDFTGLDNLIKYFDRKSLLVFYIDSKDEIREKRAIKRGSYNKTEWDRRLKDDNKVFNSRKIHSSVDYIITNNDFFCEFTIELLNCLKKEGICRVDEDC